MHVYFNIPRRNVSVIKDSVRTAQETLFFFDAWTAGYKSVSGRSCDRPSRHWFSMVSLGPRANAEMVPAFPRCLYMLLM